RRRPGASRRATRWAPRRRSSGSGARCPSRRRPSWRTTSSTTRAIARRRSPRRAASTRPSWPTSRRGGVRATKRRALGQHFLRDAGIARAIVDLVAPTAADLVIEIGPGEGALTGELARRAGRVVALEIDRGLAARLRARFPSIEVVEADARVWEYGAIARPRDGRALVVGNLPYSVGKPILAALIAARTAIDEMALMLQREVAERVAAAPGSKTYGSLSVLSQLYCDVRLALRVPPGAFRPPPAVESGVLHVRVRPAPRVPLADESRFRAVVRQR